MGIYDREYYRDEQPRGFSFGGRSMVMNLIIINVVLFILDAFTQAEPRPGMPRSMSGPVMDFLGLRARNIVEPWNWWRLLTSGFAHDGPQHIFGNMLGLFFFGRPIVQVYGSRKFLFMYLSAILIGSSTWALAYLFLRPDAVLVGASGAVTAVVLLFCFHFPKQTVYLMMVFPIPAWFLGLFLIMTDVLGQISGGDRVAHGVHLAGAIYGYLFYRTKFTLLDWVTPGWFTKLKRKATGPRLKIHAPEKAKPSDDRLDRQADLILEKLHREGENSLTPKERRILEEYSRRMKQKHAGS